MTQTVEHAVPNGSSMWGAFEIAGFDAHGAQREYRGLEVPTSFS